MTQSERSPNAEVETVCRLLQASVSRIASGTSSHPPLNEFGNCVLILSEFFGPFIDAEYPDRKLTENFQRDAETFLAWLGGCHGFMGVLVAELKLAMAGLQIGEVRKSVTPASRRGGVTNLDHLFLKSILVAAADRLRDRGGGTEAYEAELRQRGLNGRTIEGYRRQIRRTSSTSTSGFPIDASMEHFIQFAQEELKKK